MEKWIYKSYSYNAKRKDKLFLNVLIEDINSNHEHFKHNFVLSNITMTKTEINIQYSLLNNDVEIQLTDDQKKLVEENAIKIYNTYFK